MLSIRPLSWSVKTVPFSLSKLNRKPVGKLISRCRPFSPVDISCTIASSRWTAILSKGKWISLSSNKRFNLIEQEPGPLWSGSFFSRSPRQFRQLTLAPIWHDRDHATTRNQRSDDDGGHHRDDGDHPRELDEVARRSTTPQLLLLATNTVLPKITRFRASWFDGQQEASASRRRSATT